MIKLVIISDTHGHHEQIPEIPDGDVLIHCGDLTTYGQADEVQAVDQWLGTLPHRHKIVIAGNHDRCLEDMHPRDKQQLFQNCHYLEDQAVEIEGLHIYGAPWTPEFCGWAFMLERGPQIQAVWDRIPEQTDILVTHGPPLGYLDRAAHGTNRIGCAELRKAVDRIRPRLHCFGHHHGAYGFARNEHTLFCNAATCSESYQPVHPPVQLEWPFRLW